MLQYFTRYHVLLANKYKAYGKMFYTVVFK